MHDGSELSLMTIVATETLHQRRLVGQSQDDFDGAVLLWGESDLRSFRRCRVDAAIHHSTPDTWEKTTLSSLS